MSQLFTPFSLKDVTLRNRIGVSPMCQYSAESQDGKATDWHLVHLGARAAGGAGLVIMEDTAVEARGRISPHDQGLWADDQVEPLIPIVRFIESQGAVPAIQLGHAGWKASRSRPWDGDAHAGPDQGGWSPIIGPSAIPFDDDHQTPVAMTEDHIHDVINAFVRSTERAVAAGFRWLEIHGAHGYLIHSFFSPISNRRTDAYGGSFENRIRLLLQICAAVRTVWPERYPLTVRISCTDWLEGGWDLEQSIELARRLKAAGIDLIDCSSGGIAPKAPASVGAGYQVPFSEAIRKQADIPTAAVGLITSPEQAEQLIRTGQADLVLLARELLRDPHWPLHAAQKLRAVLPVPPQYQRAF